MSTILRGHRNKIRNIKDNLREWITKEEGVKEFILTRFKLLYTTDLAYSTTSFEVSQFSCCLCQKRIKEIYAPMSLKRKSKRPFGPSSPLKPLDLMVFMLDSSNISGMMLRTRSIERCGTFLR